MHDRDTTSLHIGGVYMHVDTCICTMHSSMNNNGSIVPAYI
jgi:hypothetical protein